MESGSIASWNLKEGDSFAAGDVFCSVETDKATVDFEAQDDGVLAKILVEAGPDEIKCGQPILVIVEEGEDVAPFADFKVDASSTGSSGTEPAAAAPAPTSPPTPPAASTTPTAAAPKAKGDRTTASPLAHTLAKELGYNIQLISGTGPGGRIVAADVREFVPGEDAAMATADAASGAAATRVPSTSAQELPLVGPPVQGDGFTDFAISEAAQEIAARLAQSKRNVPHYYLTVDISMDRLLQMRSSLNSSLGDDASLGVYEFLLKAAAVSMKAVPSANASWMDSVVRVYDSVDINVVVGSGDTLYTPVIRDCGKKGVKGISDALAEAMSYLDDGEGGGSSPSPPSSAVGTFTVLNVGMFGVKSCAPVIREPQACSLALGAMENRVVPNDDDSNDEVFKESVVMTATLSCDHRVVDGAVGAQWLSAFKSYVENPSTLLL